MLKVALVGAGGMGTNHASCYRKLEDVELAAVVDVDRAAAEAVADGAAVYGSLEEALQKTSVDVVDICTPTPTHSDLAVMALEAGKHLLLEKPMARTVDQCDAIIQAAKASGKTAMVGHVLRWFPEFAQAKKVIDSGGIGKPAVVHTSRGGTFPRGPESWYADFQQSGGVILDLIIHDFDWLRWCLGPVERVYARRAENYALVTLRYKSGAMAHVEGTWMRPSGFEVHFEVAGDEGLIDYSSRNAVPLKTSLKAGPEGKAAVEVPESPLAESPYLQQIRHFLECVRTGSAPAVSLEDAREAVRTSLAALESCETGQPVRLS